MAREARRRWGHYCFTGQASFNTYSAQLPGDGWTPPDIVDLHVRHLGADFARFSTEADLTSGADLRKLLVAAVRRRGGDPAQIDEYEMDIRRPTASAVVMTFVSTPR